MGGDLVVECISHSPRAAGPGFDPQPADIVTLGDEEETPVRGGIVRRECNRIWVQIGLHPRSLSDPRPASSRRVALPTRR